MRVSIEVESAMWKAVRELVPADAWQLATLHRAVSARSRLYTSCRDQLGDQRGPSDLAARALFFSVADSAKIELPLAELAWRGALPQSPRWRVLDLGAGPGAMSLGLAAWLGRNRRAPMPALDIVAVDRDKDALTIMSRAAHHLAGTIGVSMSVQTRVGDVTELDESDSFDLVLAGTVINELAAEDRLTVAKRALRAMGRDGSAVFIEPALQGTSRDLSRLRDQLLSTRLAQVVAPCTRTADSCPALATDDDWCHEDRPLELSPSLSDIARITGLRDSGAKFSYLVLRQPDATTAPWALDRAVYRVVSRPRRSKGQRSCTGCGEAGWVPLRLLKRNRTGDNRSFERIGRGDIVVVAGPALGPAGDLTREHAAARIDPLSRQSDER